MAYLQLVNNTATTLNGAINNSTTSVVITSATGWPSSGDFYFIIDSEIFKGTSISGTTITVATRGLSGTADATTAASHSNGATVTVVLTAAALLALPARFSSRDTAANRVTAGSVGGENGTIFLATDTGTLSHSNGSAWADAGAWIKIGEVAVGGGGAATIAFSSIPATYRALKLFLQGRGDNASGDTDVFIRFNGDTGNNYDFQGGLFYMVTGSTANLAYATAATSHGQLGYIAAASAPSNVASQIEAAITSYAGTTFHKSVYSQNANKIGSTVNDFRLIHTASFWRSTSAINAISLAPGGGNFAQGTVAALYGVL